MNILKMCKIRRPYNKYRQTYHEVDIQSDSTINSDQSPHLYLSIDGWLLALVCWPLLSLKLWDLYLLQE